MLAKPNPAVTLGFVMQRTSSCHQLQRRCRRYRVITTIANQASQKCVRLGLLSSQGSEHSGQPDHRRHTRQR